MLEPGRFRRQNCCLEYRDGGEVLFFGLEANDDSGIPRNLRRNRTQKRRCKMERRSSHRRSACQAMEIRDEVSWRPGRREVFAKVSKRRRPNCDDADRLHVYSSRLVPYPDEKQAHVRYLGARGRRFDDFGQNYDIFFNTTEKTLTEKGKKLFWGSGGPAGSFLQRSFKFRHQYRKALELGLKHWKVDPRNPIKLWVRTLKKFDLSPRSWVPGFQLFSIEVIIYDS